MLITDTKFQKKYGHLFEKILFNAQRFSEIPLLLKKDLEEDKKQNASKL